MSCNSIKLLFIFLASIFFEVGTAQELPVTSIVVPFSAGSAQDVFARLISEPLGHELGSRIVIVNKNGAGGTIAAAFVARAKPDGQTYLLAGTSQNLAGALYPNLTYHPLDSFRGAAFWGFSEYVLITSENMQVSDMASFIARVQSNPNAFNYASAGNGSVTHVGMSAFLRRANLQMAHIPLKGTNEIINEILSGRVHAAMVSVFSIYGYRADPRIKILATTDSHRSEQFPNLPTISESGYPKFKWISWVGLLAPAATPLEKIQNLNRAVAKVINDPVLKVRFAQLGISPKVMPQARFESLLNEEWLRVSPMISEFNITND